MTAASRARRLRSDLEIIALERGPYVSYAACGIPYYVGGLIDDFAKLLVRSPQEFKSRQDIEVRVRSEVVGIQPENGRVIVYDHESGREYEEGYDQLLLATGTEPVPLSLPGAATPGIFTVNTLGDARRLRALLEEPQLPGSRRLKRAVVVGAGYVGLELADALRRWDLETTLLTRGSQVLRALDPDMSALVEETLVMMGVHLHLGEEVVAFEAESGWVAAVVTPRNRFPADLVVLASGVRPNVSLAAEAGLPLGQTGALRVNKQLRTLGPWENIWAAGDCTETIQLATGRPFWSPLATVANKQGRVAGTNLAGGTAEFPGAFGTTMIKVGGLEIAHAGAGDSQLAAGSGIDFVTAKANARTHPAYYPGAAPITVKLTAEVGSGRLLGGEIVGGPGSAARINVVAAALEAGLTAEQVAALDLGYAPPFAPVWDPLLLAARNLCAKC